MKLQKNMKYFLILCSVFLLAYFVRLNNFDHKIIFWTEQSRSMITSLEYLKKPSLLGQEYFRTDSNSHTIFSGALFNYLLLPLILISNLNPAKVTVMFALLNIFTGFAVFLVTRKFYGVKAGVVASTLFLFSNYMIYHSYFIWNYNLLPLTGIAILYFLLENFKKHKLENSLTLGILCGIGISFQILFIIYSLVVLIINLFKSKNKFISFLLFIAGIIIGNLPMLVFDLRHNFYETTTIWQYFIDTLHGKSGESFSYYYLLPLFSVIPVFLGKVLSKLNFLFVLPILIIYIYWNLENPIHETIYLTVSEEQQAAQAITLDAKKDFNVASVIDFDKQAYPLRYFLSYQFKKNPLPDGDYQNIDLLYVLAPIEYNFAGSDTWEIKAGWPYKVTKLMNANGSFAVYKLTK
jgi:hypothetical protein